MNILVPASFTSGLSLSLLIPSDLYLAPDWALRLVMRGPAQIDLDSVASGTVHSIKSTAVETAAWLPGVYSYSLRGISGDDVVELECGSLEILPDLVAAPAGEDQRSHAVKVLASIEAVLEGRATKDQQSYTISGRTLVRTPIADLIALRTAYRKEVKNDQAGGRGSRLLGRKIKVAWDK